MPVVKELFSNNIFKPDFILANDPTEMKMRYQISFAAIDALILENLI